MEQRVQRTCSAAVEARSAAIGTRRFVEILQISSLCFTVFLQRVYSDLVETGRAEFL